VVQVEERGGHLVAAGQHSPQESSAGAGCADDDDLLGGGHRPADRSPGLTSAPDNVTMTIMASNPRGAKWGIGAAIPETVDDRGTAEPTRPLLSQQVQ
jgi:hypothetical protein